MENVKLNLSSIVKKIIENKEFILILLTAIGLFISTKYNSEIFKNKVSQDEQEFIIMYAKLLNEDFNSADLIMRAYIVENEEFLAEKNASDYSNLLYICNQMYTYKLSDIKSEIKYEVSKIFDPSSIENEKMFEFFQSKCNNSNFYFLFSEFSTQITTHKNNIKNGDNKYTEDQLLSALRIAVNVLGNVDGSQWILANKNNTGFQEKAIAFKNIYIEYYNKGKLDNLGLDNDKIKQRYKDIELWD